MLLHVPKNPFKDGTFGVVIIKHVVEHLLHPERAFTELVASLLAGGTLSYPRRTWPPCSKPWKGQSLIVTRTRPTPLKTRRSGYTDPCAGSRPARGSGWLLGCSVHQVVPNDPKVLLRSLGGFQAVTGCLLQCAG